jgi:hypothetical protein
MNDHCRIPSRYPLLWQQYSGKQDKRQIRRPEGGIPHDAENRQKHKKYKFNNIRVLSPKPAAFLPGWRRLLPGTGRSGQPAENGPGLQWLYTAPAESGDCFFAKKVYNESKENGQ